MVKVFRFLMVIFIIIGIGFLLYPTVSSFIADYTSTKVIVDYERQLEEIKKIEVEKQKQELHNYFNVEVNLKNSLKGNYKKSKEVKKQKEVKLRDIKTTYKMGELLGYVQIPKIDLYLPIYEGTYESILMKGIGHLEHSSLPVGGKGTHSIFTGHSGMASATLFSRLEELEVKDIFVIRFLDENLAYKVDNIKIVTPDEADKYIQVDKEKDFVTLVTCYPKTINTHRLLVRGYRVPYDEETGIKEISKQLEEHQNNMMFKIVIIAITFLLILIIITAIFRKLAYKR